MGDVDVVKTLGGTPRISGTLVVVNNAESNMLRLSDGAEFRIGWEAPAILNKETGYYTPLAFLRCALTVHFQFVRVDDNTVVEHLVHLAGLTAAEFAMTGDYYPGFFYAVYLYLDPLETNGFRAGLYKFKPYIEWEPYLDVVKGKDDLVFSSFAMAPNDYFFQIDTGTQEATPPSLTPSGSGSGSSAPPPPSSAPSGSGSGSSGSGGGGAPG